MGFKAAMSGFDIRDLCIRGCSDMLEVAVEEKADKLTARSAKRLNQTCWK